MKWQFFKTNWFPLAVVIVILAAIVKRNLAWPGTDAGKSHPGTEKLTNTGVVAAIGESQAALFTWSDRTSVDLPNIPESVAIPFLQRFGRVVVGEQEKFGIPASILLACAYVNSFSGQRDWAFQFHNYFALGCSPDWTGATETTGGVCIRRYEKAWDSFRDFSKCLSGRDDFADMRQSCGKDWKAWVKVLGAKKISDVSDFGTQLEQVIERYRLYELDK